MNMFCLASTMFMCLSVFHFSNTYTKTLGQVSRINTLVRNMINSLSVLWVWIALVTISTKDPPSIILRPNRYFMGFYSIFREYLLQGINPQANYVKLALSGWEIPTGEEEQWETFWNGEGRFKINTHRTWFHWGRCKVQELIRVTAC